MDELIVPVREEVRTVYVVPLPTFTTIEAADRVIATEVARTVTGKGSVRLPGALDALVLSWVREGDVKISVLEGLGPVGRVADANTESDSKTLPPELQQYLRTAPAFAVIKAAHPASLVAVQEWRARATAIALAAGLKADLFELSALRSLDVPTAMASLPEVVLVGDPVRTQVTFDARPWITTQAFQHLGSYWVISDGMEYFGLPELRIGGTRRDLSAELTEIVHGLACHMLCCLAGDISEARGDAAVMTLPRAVPIPEVLEFHRKHLDSVRQVPNRGGAWTSVRFSLDEGASGEFWLTICPPADWDLGEETFIGNLCHAMFGFEKPRLHYLPELRTVIDSSVPVPAARRPVLRSRRPV